MTLSTMNTPTNDPKTTNINLTNKSLVSVINNLLTKYAHRVINAIPNKTPEIITNWFGELNIIFIYKYQYIYN